MKAAFVAAVLLASAAGAAHAQPAAQSSAGACFNTRDMGNHVIADNHTMYVRIRNRETWKVTVRGACFAGSTRTDPILTRSPPGSTHICKPIDLDLSITHPGSGFATPCIVDSLTRLTPTEAAALPRKLRP